MSREGPRALRYGFAGLGLMGSRMARRLAGLAEDSVGLYNRTPPTSEAFPGPDFEIVDSPSALGRSSDVVFVMLSTPDACRDVLVRQGLLEAMSGCAEGTVVNMSTVGPEAAEDLGRDASRAGVDYLDAPVLGSIGAAEAGALTVLIGGSSGAVARARPALMRMGDDLVLLGCVGKASAAKLLFNAMLGIGMAAFAEILELGGALGVSRQWTLDALPGSPVAPAFLKAKGEKIRSADFEPEFSLRWMLKDLDLARKAAQDRDGPSPRVLDAARRRFQQAMEEGKGSLDFSAVADPGSSEPGEG